MPAASATTVSSLASIKDLTKRSPSEAAQAFLTASTGVLSADEEAQAWLTTISPQLKDQPPLQRALVDALWLATHTGNLSQQDASQPPPLWVATVQQLVSEHSTLAALLGDSLEAEHLEKLGSSVVETGDWPKRLRQINTATFYRQSKFNLLVESSEGYSKFCRHILQDTTQTLQPDYLHRLMGTFRLDPNRCVDLVLDVLEQDLNNSSNSASDSNMPNRTPKRTAWLAWLEPYADKIPALFGFKLSQAVDDDKRASDSILQCLAWWVVHHNDKEKDSQATNHDMLLRVWQFIPNAASKEDATTLEWSDLVQRAYEAVTAAATESVTQQSRVRLNSSTSSAPTTSASQAAAETAQKELQADLHTQFVLLLLQWQQDGLFLSQEESSLIAASTWSALAVVLPESIGKGILEAVATKLRDSESATLLPPWNKDLSDNGTHEEWTPEECMSQLVEPLALTFESGCIRLDPTLYCQLCRFLQVQLDTAKDTGWIEDFVHDYLLPSLGLFPDNPALSLEVWKITEALPWQTRYSLYRTWRGAGLERMALRVDKASRKPCWWIESELNAGKQARYSLKRLSKDTLRDTSRAVAKVCHSHPLVVFTTILNQIESYDNLVQVMVEALRFCSPLSLDVLAFCILDRLSGSGGGMVNRSRLKEDGVNVSQWLQSLEAFTGAFYKRFHFVEFQGILCYMMQRLKQGQVMELGVLRTLLKTSGGWAFCDYAPAASLSMTQLQGRAGTKLLQRETMSFGVVDDVHVAASETVRRVLQTDSMGVSLLILLSQMRHHVVFESTTDRPVKLIGNLVDTCQVVMAILLDFLTHNLQGTSSEAISQYASSLPSMKELFETFQLDVPSIWMLCRPLVRVASDSMDDKVAAFGPSDAMTATVKSFMPPETWNHMTTDLFETFYTMTLHDLYCPEHVYKMEQSRLEREAERLSRKSTIPPPTSVQPGATPVKSDEEELERVKRVKAGLMEDLPKHREHVATKLELLESIKTNFFPPDSVSEASSATRFLTSCVYPRCMQGPDDAMFCSFFVSELHRMETPGFGTLSFLDSFFSILSRGLYGMTEGEAANVSLALCESWKMVSRWRYDEGAFAAEVEGKPGSFMVKETGDESDSAQPVTFEDYKRLYNKWHASIGAVCLGCLKSTEYMYIRNCLIVLSRMVEEYPTRPGLANKLLAALQPLQDESYALADIRAGAQAYSTQLIKARDDGVWKEEDAATVNARQKREQAAAAARQLKAEQQMEEMKRESEKISSELGGGRRGRADTMERLVARDDRRDRPLDRDVRRERPLDRDDRRDRPLDRDDRRDRPVEREDSRDRPVERDDRRDRPVERDDRRDRPVERLPPPPPPDDRRRTGYGGPSREPPTAAADRWPRDRGPSGNSGAPGAGRGGRDLEGRWQRGPAAESRGVGDNRTAGTKRSRPSSPVEQGENREDQRSNKRARNSQAQEPEDGEEAPPSRPDESGGGGGRRGRTRRNRK